MDVFPDEPGARAEQLGLTIRVSRELYDRLELVAELWNRGDAVLGVKRSRKWEKASVLRRLLASQLDGLGHQLGGWPGNDSKAREEWIQRALSHLPKR